MGRCMVGVWITQDPVTCFWTASTFSKGVIAAYEAAATAAGATTGGVAASVLVEVPVLPIPRTPDTPRAPRWSFGPSL
jgi:hypothetical protein